MCVCVCELHMPKEAMNDGEEGMPFANFEKMMSVPSCAIHCLPLPSPPVLIQATPNQKGPSPKSWQRFMSPTGNRELKPLRLAQ